MAKFNNIQINGFIFCDKDWSSSTQYRLALSTYNIHISDSGSFIPYDQIKDPENIVFCSLKDKIVPIENLSATLYFDKNCKFPRNKLENTKFKRCIKLDKADYIVVSKKEKTRLSKVALNSNYRFDTTIFKCGEYTFMFNQTFNEYSQISQEEFVKNFRIHLSNMKFGWRVRIDKNKLGKPEVIFRGKCVFIEADKELLFMDQQGLINKPYITDEDLDKVVSNELQEITWEDIETFQEMLLSTDADTRSLALKLIPTYNVYEYPKTITTLLAVTNTNWYYDNLGISTTSMFEKIGYRKAYVSSFPANLNLTLQSTPNGEKDLELTKRLLKDRITKYANSLLDAVSRQITRDCNLFKLKINCEIE